MQGRVRKAIGFVVNRMVLNGLTVGLGNHLSCCVVAIVLQVVKVFGRARSDGEQPEREQDSGQTTHRTQDYNGEEGSQA